MYLRLNNIEEETAYHIRIPMDKLIPELENLYGADPQKMVDRLSNKFISLMNAVKKYSPESKSKAIKQACSGGQLPNSDLTIEFTEDLPEIITFYMEYQEYFTITDKLSDLTKTNKETNGTEVSMQSYISTQNPYKPTSPITPTLYSLVCPSPPARS